MNSTVKMNHFLQRMLKKNDDELEDQRVIQDPTRLKVEYSPRSNKSSNWIKKLGGCSPSKRDLASATKSASMPITPRPIGEYWNDIRQRSVLDPIASKNSTKSDNMPDLEKIIRDFEMGFLSPTKQETKDTTKSGRFVKQIVAAFEEKYKPYNDFKMEPAKSTSESDDSDDNSFEDEKTVAEMMEESTTFLGTTYVIDSLETRLSSYLDSYEAKSSFRERQSASDEESESNSSNSIDLGKCSFAMDEELRMSTPTRETSQKNETKMSQNSRINISNMETRETSSTSMVSSSTLVRRDSSIKRERKPQIVGAYLKRPIEVDDTSIDWIPITGKKLPRKKSFKRLLSVLTGKKSSEKSSKLYCSQMNLREETSKELLHDSGYDEKSCSSSSLVSLVSIADLLLQQDNYDVASTMADRRVDNMTTFRQSPVPGAEPNFNNDLYDFPEGSSINDDISDTCSISSKKLLLEEVPRSELRLSLGPAFPCGARINVTTSLDRRTNKSTTTNKNLNSSMTNDDLTPLASPLPKHPFISLGKKSLNDSDDSQIFTGHEDAGNMTFREFDNIELRRNHSTWKFPTDDIEYDVPRCYLSKSEPGLVTVGRDIGKLTNEIVYDVPKLKIPRRPRSSVYDDAVSLKRRNDNYVSYSAPSSTGFYAFPSQEEPHYATVKPRNTRINPSKELLRSVGDLTVTEPRRSDYYYGRDFDQIRTF